MALTSARLAARENRFVLRCTLPSGEEVAAHLGNTGRLRELLTPGAELLLRHTPGPGRKTSWEAVLVKAGTQWVSLNSQLPNRLAAQGVRDGMILLPDFPPPFTVKREAAVGDSRIDIAAVKPDGETFYLEVKGVTLVREGIAQFPDAPTGRGVKHLHTLARIAREGGRAGVLFIVQRPDAVSFTPNPDRPEFAAALREAAGAGVAVLAWKCRVDEDGVRLEREMDVSL